MPRDLPSSAGPAQRSAFVGPWALIALLIGFALPDLLSPPISPTIVRQTQTFSQTVHFASGGFSPRALTIDINGPEPFHVVYEFPLYQGVVGALFKIFGASFFAGKLVSLLAAIASLLLLRRLVAGRWGEPAAWRTGCFFAMCPIAMLINTAFQPDALALALALGSLLALERWRESPGRGRWLVFLVLLLAAGLAKFTVLVPFAPLIVAGVLMRDGSFRRPTAAEFAAALILFFVPFTAWYLFRARLMDPAYLIGESDVFLIGDLRRFLHASYYVKPAFILGGMVCCGAGVALAAVGMRRTDPTMRLLLAGVPLHFALLPTAADQTYYAYPLVPVCALLMGAGLMRLEEWAESHRATLVRAVALGAWLAGFAVAAPYTLRHDDVTLAAARGAREATGASDLLLVLNMHDRGTGIGGFNPSLVTLAERRGWNLSLASTDVAALRTQIEDRRRQGAKLVAITWFTPELDPWFTPWLPAGFSRCPRLDGAPVDGAAIARALAGSYRELAGGANFTLLRLD